MHESVVRHRTFYSPSLERDKRYCIYLPRGYGGGEGLRYSTIYLLPGLMDYERTWVDRGRVHEHMDQLIGEGLIGEMIVVMPDKDAAATDPAGAEAFSRYLAGDLIGHIDHEFSTLAVRGHRGVEGLSLGATWAFRLSMQFPYLFSSVGCLSGSFNEDAYQQVREKQDYLQQEGTRFRVGVGLQEQESIPGNEAFARFMRKLGFYCELDAVEGPHDWPLWQQQVRHSLQFHYYSFNPR